MYDYLITKDTIIKAALALQAYDCSAFSPEYRKGIRAALFELENACGQDTQLGALFHLAAQTVRVKRNRSLYDPTRTWAFGAMRVLGSDDPIKEVFGSEY